MFETTLSPSNIRILSGEGNVVLEAEAFDLEVMITQAQQGLDIHDPASTSVWVERFRQMIEQEYEIEISRTNAWQLVEVTKLAMTEMKKKLLPMLKSLNSTELIPSS